MQNTKESSCKTQRNLHAKTKKSSHKETFTQRQRNLDVKTKKT